MDEESQEELLTIAEVAKELRVSRTTVGREIARGNLEAIYAGEQARITRRTLEAYKRRPKPKQTRKRRKKLEEELALAG